jgi:hypothetical protein
MLLNDANEVFIGATRQYKAVNNSIITWPRVETWSPWRLVQAANGTAPIAWFGANITHYDAGTHHQVAWRYSSLGRIRYHGIMRCTADLAAGADYIYCNMSASELPEPGTINRMSLGLASPDYTALWTGVSMRYDLKPHASYHHVIGGALSNAAVVTNGSWMSIDATYSLAVDV